jgi:hypothetical protein
MMMIVTRKKVSFFIKPPGDSGWTFLLRERR